MENFKHPMRSSSLEIMELIQEKNKNSSISNLKLAHDAKFCLQTHFRPNVCCIVYFTDLYRLFPNMQFKSLKSQAETDFSKHGALNF